ncbi:hypothetical protein WJX84_005528 [Apatococcus fuscideae]|uniref:Uncharacterized protein n=1 Tax=Apatococcus fuscideae TaxID=2026836 RepID=A0AAW1TCS6_9CHLO
MKLPSQATGFAPSPGQPMHHHGLPRGYGLTPHHIREHPGFKRNKTTLLSMGIAVVLVGCLITIQFQDSNGYLASALKRDLTWADVLPILQASAAR